MDQLRGYLVRWASRPLSYAAARRMVLSKEEGGLGQTLWRVMRVQPHQDLRIGDIMEGIDKFSQGSPCWGLPWVATSAFVWHIWGKRNRRYKEDVRQPPMVVGKNFIRDENDLFLSWWFLRSRLEEQAIVKSATIGAAVID